MNFGSPRFPDSPPIIPRFPEYWKISGKNLKISKKIRKFQRKQNNLGENLKKGKFSFIFILFGCVFKKLYFYSIYSTKNSSLKSCWFGITLKFFIPQFPDSPTRFPEEWLSIPHSPRNEKIAFLDSPIPRGMKSAGELTALSTRTQVDFSLIFFYSWNGNRWEWPRC